MEKNERELKKGKIGWIITGFVLAPLGGIFGLIIGSIYAFGKYERQTKILGWLMILISIIMMNILKNS